MESRINPQLSDRLQKLPHKIYKQISAEYLAGGGNYSSWSLILRGKQPLKIHEAAIIEEIVGCNCMQIMDPHCDLSLLYQEKVTREGSTDENQLDLFEGTPTVKKQRKASSSVNGN